MLQRRSGWVCASVLPLRSQQLDMVCFLRGTKTPTVQRFVLVPERSVMGQLGAAGLYMGPSLRARGGGEAGIESCSVTCSHPFTQESLVSEGQLTSTTPGANKPGLIICCNRDFTLGDPWGVSKVGS